MGQWDREIRIPTRTRARAHGNASLFSSHRPVWSFDADAIDIRRWDKGGTQAGQWWDFHVASRSPGQKDRRHEQVARLAAADAGVALQLLRLPRRRRRASARPGIWRRSLLDGNGRSGVTSDRMNGRSRTVVAMRQQDGRWGTLRS
jgi:hypothetical protein